MIQSTQQEDIMMLKKRLLTAAPFVMGALLCSTAAPAAILVTGWQIDVGAVGDQVADDLTGFGILGATNIPTGSNGINQLAFTGLYQSTQTTYAAGGTQLTNLAGDVTQAQGDAGNILQTSTSKVLNLDFEITFVSTTSQSIDSVDPGTGVAVTSHLSAGSGADGFTTNGQLDIYIDNITSTVGNKSGANAVADPNAALAGQGLQDGVLVASFQIIPQSATGSFNPGINALNGQDNALFELIDNPFDAILVDLGAGYVSAPLGTTLAFTDADTNADPDNNDVTDSNFIYGPFADVTCTLDDPTAGACGQESGTFKLERVPEPGSLALIGLGVAAMGASLRRRKARS
jgi:hypothetical protein